MLCLKSFTGTLYFKINSKHDLHVGGSSDSIPLAHSWTSGLCFWVVLTLTLKMPCPFLTDALACSFASAWNAVYLSDFSFLPTLPLVSARSPNCLLIVGTQ